MRIALLVSFILSACASLPPLAPTSVRTKEYKAETKLNKDKAFKKTQEWFAKTFNNANRVVQLSDPASGKIIGKGNTDCAFLNEGKTHSMQEHLKFTITTEARDKAVRVVIEDIESVSIDGQWYTQKPSNQEQADRIFNECIKPIATDLVNYVGGIKTPD